MCPVGMETFGGEAAIAAVTSKSISNFNLSGAYNINFQSMTAMGVSCIAL